jgi:hypothetical protein
MTAQVAINEGEEGRVRRRRFDETENVAPCGLTKLQITIH